MSKNKKIGIKLLIVSLIISLLCFFVLLYIEIRVLSDYERVDVVRAKTTIEAGIEITEENIDKYFEVVSIPKDDKVEHSYSTLGEIGNAFIKVDIEEKEQLTASKFISLSEDVMKNFMNPCEISYKVDTAANAVSGTLRRGDYVAAYRYNSISGELEQITDKLFISGAYNGSGGEISEDDVKGSDTSSVMFTFIVENSEIHDLQTAFRQGDVFLVKIENIK